MALITRHFYQRLNQPHTLSTTNNQGSDIPILYEIPKGMSAVALAQDLAKRHIIDNSFLFRMYLRLTKKDRTIKSGVYYLPKQTSAFDIAKLFTSGKTATLSVTIPEGLTSWELFGLLKKYYKLDSLVFDSLVHDPKFSMAMGIIAPSLEGYLFPDTYKLPLQISERDILSLLTRQWHNIISRTDTSNSDVYRRFGMHGLMTLASIVEGEAATVDEMQVIAGVFYNRLNIGMPLGADPCIRFALKKMTGSLYRSELRRNTPYNTRLYKGLPPGPVNSPGQKAIIASLHPAKTEYLFFVAKDNGTREHYFSRTNREHNEFKKLRQVNQTKK
ncbi:MAG: endolytic transglycosylase MltG [Fibrobacteria bacterium]|nr:endolytic transglycosylase MltG [Fibrobacteria bacterium]